MTDSALFSIKLNLLKISYINRENIKLILCSTSNRDSIVSRQVSFDVALSPVYQPIFDGSSNFSRT